MQFLTRIFVMLHNKVYPEPMNIYDSINIPYMDRNDDSSKQHHLLGKENIAKQETSSSVSTHLPSQQAVYRVIKVSASP